jgi:hypothetical protein
MPPKLVISRHHGYNHPRPVIGVVKRWDSGFSCERVVPIVAIDTKAVGDAKAPPTVSGLGGIVSEDQMSIFSAISIASSTSMPRYLTVLSIFECPSKSWTARRFPVRR